MPSAAFERFRFSFFEDTDSARQGLDQTALAALESEERVQAEDMLLRYLPDSRGIIGLGVLRSRRAEPALVALFEAEARARREREPYPDGDWLPYTLIHAAKVLWQIRPDPRWPLPVIEVLASSAEWTFRQEATQALYDVRDPAAARALIAALDDPEALVRYHAARGLLANHGLPAESKDLEHMMYRVMADDPARRAGGKRDILAAIAGREIAAP
ncbi:MAG: HEAT repeat domain-containing protein [Xanthobacteraceae bacterium]|jgi:HEAT repeats